MNFFAMLHKRLNVYDGDSVVFDEGNDFIVMTLETLYGLRAFNDQNLPRINRDFFIKNDNPFLPFYFALQTRRSRFAFKKLEHEYRAIQKHKKHPLYLLTMGLASLYNLGTPKDTTAAYRYFLRGSKQDCVICTFYLGKFLMMGDVAREVKRDISGAIKLFQQASKAGLAIATHELAFLFALREAKEDNYQMTLRHLNLLAEQAQSPKEKVYANFSIQMYKHFNIRDKTKNRPQKEHWLLFADRYAAPNSALLLYFFYQEAKEFDDNAYAQSIKYLFAAASTNHPVALFELGVEYLKGSYLPANFTMALEHLEKSAKFGYAQAYLYIASLYASDEKRYDAQTVAKYIELEHERILTTVKKKGHINYPFTIRNHEIHSAQKLYGYLYFELGNLVMMKKLYRQALRYYETALDYRFTKPTLLALGDLYAREITNPHDNARPFKAYQSYFDAFKESNVTALKRLAKCFALGFGTIRNEAKAVQFIENYIQAAKKNEIETLINFYTDLSYEFNEGRIITRDVKLANYYLEKALSLQKN